MSTPGAGGTPGHWFREGEVWVVGLGESRTPLKDSKGLHHIAALLARPGEEIAAIDLVAIAERTTAGGGPVPDPALTTGGLGHAGELLDAEAKAAYRSRLEELREEIEEAERFGDDARSERASMEMEFLARELSAAVGLGGRDRRAASAAERARVNITRAIKTTIDRVAEHDRALGAHLRAGIRTGGFCSYEARLVEPVVWDLTGTGPAASPAEPVAAEPSAPEPAARREAGPARRRGRRGHALVEREEQLAEIEQALDIAAGGCGDLIVVDGPAGIGKSALLAAVSGGAAERGFRILSARASELESGFAFGIAHQLFDTALRRLPSADRDTLLRGAVTPAAAILGYASARGDEHPADAEGASLAIFNGLFWLAMGLAQEQPLLILIDDAQWADSQSAAWLTFCAARVQDAPMLFLLGARPLDADADAQLSDLLDGGDAGAIELGPLSPGAVAEVVRAAFRGASDGFCAACHASSAGNPFYLHELLSAARAAGVDAGDAGAEEVRALTPDSVTQLVERRLRGLPPTARQVAHSCAVLGSTSDIRLVADVAGVDSEEALNAADALVAAGVLVGRRPLDFVHPLVRAAVNDDLAIGARTRLHERAASVLAAAGASAAEIAVHLLHARPAGDPAVVERLRTAAATATGRGSPRAAVELLERALAEPPEGLALPATLLELGRARYDLGSRAAAEADLERALVECADHELRAEIVLELCRDFDEMDVGARVALIDETVDALGDGRDDLKHRLQARSLALLSDAVLVSASPSVRAEFDERLSRVMAAADGDSVGERELRSMYASQKALDGAITADEALRLVTEALDDGTLMRRLSAGIWAGESALEVLCMVDAFDQADRHAREAERLARDHGAVVAESSACMMRVIAALQRGALLEAGALLRSVFAIAAHMRTPYVSGVANQLQVWVSLERGEFVTAEEACRILDPAIMPMGTPYSRGKLQAASGAHDLAVPDLRVAVAALESVGRWRGALGSPRADLAMSLAAMGEAGEARALAQAEVDVARRFGAPTALAAALRALGHATGAEAGLAHFSEAVGVLASSQAVLARAHALHDLGVAQHALGMTEAARTSLRHALDLATRCAALALREHIRGGLMAAGEKTAPLALTGAALLTASELRIAKLAAEGSPDLEIAQSLFLTVPAVERSLALIQAKLGIASREELAAALDAEATPSVAA